MSWLTVRIAFRENPSYRSVDPRYSGPSLVKEVVRDAASTITLEPSRFGLKVAGDCCEHRGDLGGQRMQTTYRDD